MITKFSWRRAVAVPAVLTLALGGALLSATAAQAAPASLVISTPEAGATTASRTVVVSGTVAAGATVDVFKGTDDSGTRADRINTGNSTTWSTTLTYTDTDAVDQSVYVTGVYGGSGFSDPQARAFVLPAVAPAETFAVTAPEGGQQLSSRTVTFSGTGTSGSTVNVLGADGDRLPGTGAVAVVAGQWSLEYTYPETVDRNQSVRVTQVTGGAGTGDVPVAFVLPQGQTLDVVTPAQGTTTATRTVTFSGTGTAGSTVNVLGTDGSRLAPAVAVANDGTWSATVVYADDAAVAQTVRVTQVTGGAGSGDITRSFNLSAAVVPPTDVTLEAPVITSPTEGQVVVGDTLTITGTGTPGANVAVVVYPTDQAPQSSAPFEAAMADDEIVIDENGDWSTTVTGVRPGSFTAVAFSFLLDTAGQPVVGDDGLPLLAIGDEVDFSVIAAVVPAGTPATPIATGTTGLAYTGSEGTEAAIGIAAAVLLLGSTLMVLARRRAKLATTDVAGE